MATSFTEKDILERVRKDSNDRLIAELLIAFPTKLNNETVKLLSREQCVRLVTKGRLALKQLTKIQVSVEDQVPFEVGVDTVEPPTAVVTDPMQMMMEMFKQMNDAAERVRKEERAERDRAERVRAERDQAERDRAECDRAERKEEREVAEQRRQAEQKRSEEVERRREERRVQDEDRARQDKIDAEAQRQAELEAVRIRTEAQIQAANERHRESMSRDSRKDIRVKRASDVLRDMVGTIPSDPLSLPTFFFHLERQFVLNAIDDDLHLPLLNQLLNDKARKLIARLSDAESSSYPDLKIALLREFQLTPSKYRDNFMTIVKRRDETFIQLTTRLEIGLKFYLESRKIEMNDATADLFKLLVADRLKECVPDFLRDFVRDKEIRSLLWLSERLVVCQVREGRVLISG